MVGSAEGLTARSMLSQACVPVAAIDTVNYAEPLDV